MLPHRVDACALRRAAWRADRHRVGIPLFGGGGMLLAPMPSRKLVAGLSQPRLWHRASQPAPQIRHITFTGASFLPSFLHFL